MALSTADAAHLLRRSGFGVTQAKLDELTQLSSRNAAIDRVLDLTNAPAATLPIDPANVPDQYMGWWKMADWWLERMRTSPTPIVEKLTLFWHGHFPSAFDKVGEIGILAKQNLTLRQHALGDFHALAQAIAIDPAMLWYLDNALNSVASPQENFGRELMELFTLGVGQYTQADVVAMTRAWTGHGVDASGVKYAYRSSWHDKGSKTLFGKTRNWNGPAALTEILKGSKAVPSSRFITAKLFSFLAYPVTVADPVVVTLATAFRASGLNLMTLVRDIFRSDAFWSPKARYALVRTPVEWVVAGLQATGLPASAVEPQWALFRAGHNLFGPPDVSGWKQNAVWLSTAGSWSRSQFATQVQYYSWLEGMFAGVEGLTPQAIADEGFRRFGITEPSPTTRAAIEAWAAKAQADQEWSTIPPILTQLLLLSPDFQVA